MTGAPARAAPSFTVVTSGELSGRFKLSGDGSTLAYSLGNLGTYQSYRWRAGAGSQPIPFAQGTAVGGISQDGSVVLGLGNGGIGTYRWSEATGVQTLDLGLSSWPVVESVTMSSNGATVVGAVAKSNLGWWESFRWTEGAGSAGTFAASVNRPPMSESVAEAVSADGSAVAGRWNGPQGRFAYRWTASGGVQELWLSPHMEIDARISADGQVVAGTRLTDSGHVAQRWSAADGVVDLLPPAGWSRSQVTAVDGDGSLVLVVASDPSSPHFQTVLWDRAGAPQSLEDYLAGRGLSLPTWTSLVGLSISDDGQTFAGFGVDGAGQRHAWIATVPEPSTWCVTACASTLLLRRRRRRRASRAIRAELQVPRSLL
jgi:hypothetical protein